MKPAKRANSPISGPDKRDSALLYHLVCIAILISTTFMTFWPILHNGFVNWDDNYLILGTIRYRGLAWSNIRWMFSTYYMSSYAPLSWLSYALDYKLWGLKPFGYHLTDLLLHTANVVLFYFLGLRLLLLAMPEVFKAEKKKLAVSALFAALFFGLHPLRVESVAWASERRDVLCGFFYLLAILSYLHLQADEAVQKHRARWLGATLTLYTLALLSKAMAVSLPLALIILDIYPLRLLTWDPREWLVSRRLKLLWEKLPFFVLALAAGIITCTGKNPVPSGVMVPLRHYGLSSRLAQACYGLVFYLWKTVFPLHLFPLHEKPPHLDVLHWPYIGCVFLTAAISGLVIFLRRRWDAGPALWLFYVVTLAPVLGLIQYGVQMVGDRYSYLPCLGLALLIGAGVGKFLNLNKGRAKNGMVLGGLTLIIFGLSRLTWEQTHVWHDSTTLWSYILSLEPNSDFAHDNLGDVFFKEGNITGAITEYKKALAFNPDNLDALYSLGSALIEIGKPEQAAVKFRRAIGIYPDFAGFYYALGAILTMEENRRGAEAEYKKAIGIDPHFISAYIKLADSFISEGNLKEAVAVYRQALKANPKSTTIYLNLASTLIREGKIKESVEVYRQALKVNPNFAPAYYSLGIVFASERRNNDAILEFKRVLAIDPRFDLARQRLIELQRNH